MLFSGNYTLARVLPNVFTQQADHVLRHVTELVHAMEHCGVSERVSLLQVFGMVAKTKPKVSLKTSYVYFAKINIEFEWVTNNSWEIYRV